MTWMGKVLGLLVLEIAGVLLLVEKEDVLAIWRVPVLVFVGLSSFAFLLIVMTKAFSGEVGREAITARWLFWGLVVLAVAGAVGQGLSGASP